MKAFGIIQEDSVVLARANTVNLQQSDTVYILDMGYYDWDPTSIEPDNGLTVIKRTAFATGRLVLVAKALRAGAWVKQINAAYTITDADAPYDRIEITGAVTITVGTLTNIFSHLEFIQMDANVSTFEGMFTGEAGQTQTAAVPGSRYELERHTDGTVMLYFGT